MFRRLVTSGTAVLLGLTAPFLSATGAHAAQGAAERADAVAETGRAVTVIAHRGASAYAPENTLAAVRKAHALGVRWVENDVQRTRDGRLVVIHDTTLSRTTNAEQVYPGRAPWNVGDFTLAEIEKLDAGSWFGPAFAGERIPTLKQYLDLLDHTGQSLLLEVKAPELYPGVEVQIVAELGAEGWLSAGHVAGRLAVQSFSADSVKRIHWLRSQVKTGFLGTPPVANLPQYARFTDEINPPHRDASAAYISAVHKLKGAHGKPLEVYAWTVNDKVTARRLVRDGVDGIISNTPDTVLSAVRR